MGSSTLTKYLDSWTPAMLLRSKIIKELGVDPQMKASGHGWLSVTKPLRLPVASKDIHIGMPHIGVCSKKFMFHLV